MILELVVAAALAVGVYNYFTDASFKARVTNDLADLESKVPSFVSRVKAVYGKVAADIEKNESEIKATIKKL